MAHWADNIADALRPPDREQILATGISPSGEIHVGNLREVMTGDAVYRVLRERDRPAKLIFIADDLDPLRRVYPFLDAKIYELLIGRSLSHIPCPCEQHTSYASHFLEPFLASLKELAVDVQVVRAHELYASGRMDSVIEAALLGTRDIAVILEELTGKTVAADWSPFDPRCTSCERLTEARVTDFDAAARTVSFRCKCGAEDTVPFAGGGKLTWRVDWPARWKVLGVTVEPFGKDHASRGGSYDTGVRICREVFGTEPPTPIPYEWISLKGKGDMSSSKGNVLSIHRMLEVASPDLLRYLVLRAEPQRAIRFDPGLPLLQLFDELENTENRNHNVRAAELARVGAVQDPGVPFRHLVTVGQVANFDLERSREVLARTGYESPRGDLLTRRLGYVRHWLEEFAPPEARFSLCDDLPEQAKALPTEQRAFLSALAEQLPDSGTGEDLHTLIYELIQGRGGDSPAPYFGAIYLALIGKERGPRAGHFVAALPAAFVKQRLREAATAGT